MQHTLHWPSSHVVEEQHGALSRVWIHIDLKQIHPCGDITDEVRLARKIALCPGLIHTDQKRERLIPRNSWIGHTENFGTSIGHKYHKGSMVRVTLDGDLEVRNLEIQVTSELLTGLAAILIRDLHEAIDHHEFLSLRQPASGPLAGTSSEKSWIGTYAAKEPMYLTIFYKLCNSRMKRKGRKVIRES
jgi:hypothetical protein